MKMPCYQYRDSHHKAKMVVRNGFKIVTKNQDLYKDNPQFVILKFAITGLDNGLSPGRRQAII